MFPGMENYTGPSRRTALALAAATGLLTAVTPVLPAYAAPASGPGTPLRTIAPGAGVKKVFRDVFKASTFLDMLLVNDPNRVPKLVAITSGGADQFQVFDAATGRREFVASTPGGEKITSTLAWDQATGTVYAGSGNTLLAFSFAKRSLVSLGAVAPDATAVYGFDVDSTGRVWGGSYPDGIIWNYTPKTGKFVSLPALDAETDYVQAIGIWKDTVFAGTASVKPHMVSFPANNPGKQTVIKMPDSGPTGFVHRIFVRGDRMFVFAEDSANVSRCYIYNPAQSKWEGQYKLPSASRAFSDRMDPVTWHTAQASLVKTDTATMTDTILCPTKISTARSVLVSGDRIFVAGTHEDKPVVAQYSISAAKETARVRPDVLIGALTVQSLIASDHGLLYYGGYLGDGLASLNPDTDARWKSGSAAGISQIEHLMQFNTNRLYIGSYGSAKLYSYDRDKMAPGDAAFTHITTLRKPYMQSRPFAWAAAGGKVLVGTVPEYGHRGGALGIIDPVTNQLDRVLNKFIPEQSIVGLGGFGDIAYGTTSARGGYGVDDARGDAAVFAYNVRTDVTLWVSYLKGHRDLYSPILINGVLYVATINGLLALNPANGNLQETMALRNRTARPAYQNARAVQVPGTTRIVHSAGSIVTLIDVKERTRSLLGDDDLGMQIAVTPTGRIFATHQKKHIVELHAAPVGSIQSPASLVTINAAGQLMVSASNGAGGYSQAAKVGSGWDPGTIISFHVVDWNSDGILDILVQRTSGVLQVYRGKPGGGFEAPVNAAYGFAKKKLAVGRWTDSAFPTVIGVDPDGTVRRHPAGAGGTIGTGVVIGSGWKGREITMLDMDGSGRQGLLGRSGAKLVYQMSNGAGGFSGPLRTVASAGWSDTAALASTAGHLRGKAGLLSIRRSGALQYISSQGQAFGGIINYPGNLTGSLLAGSPRIG